MKRISILLTVIIVVLLSAFLFKTSNVATEEKTEIVFHKGTWQEALDKAKLENKLVFADIYAVWCGPCKKLKSKTFVNAKVAAYFNEHFINVAIDGEKGEGPVLSKKFKVTAYPTLIFLDHTGKVIELTMGYHNPRDFLELGEYVKSKVK